MHVYNNVHFIVIISYHIGWLLLFLILDVGGTCFQVFNCCLVTVKIVSDAMQSLVALDDLPSGSLGWLATAELVQAHLCLCLVKLDAADEFVDSGVGTIHSFPETTVEPFYVVCCSWLIVDRTFIHCPCGWGKLGTHTDQGQAETGSIWGTGHIFPNVCIFHILQPQVQIGRHCWVSCWNGLSMLFGIMESLRDELERDECQGCNCFAGLFKRGVQRVFTLQTNVLDVSIVTLC